MIARLILVVLLFGMVLSQKRPPPPEETSLAEKCTSRSCPRWIFCGRPGRWIQVTRDTCPVAFNDPDFSDHQCHCSSAGSLYQQYPGSYMWTFPGFGFCGHMPYCFCPALEKCNSGSISNSNSFRGK